jgi:hypothetical protein
VNSLIYEIFAQQIFASWPCGSEQLVCLGFGDKSVRFCKFSIRSVCILVYQEIDSKLSSLRRRRNVCSEKRFTLFFKLPEAATCIKSMKVVSKI